MTALPAGLVCVIVLVLALGMFTVLSHLAIRFIDRYEARSMTGRPPRAGRPPR